MLSLTAHIHLQRSEPFRAVGLAVSEFHLNYLYEGTLMFLFVFKSWVLVSRTVGGGFLQCSLRAAGCVFFTWTPPLNWTPWTPWSISNSPDGEALLMCTCHGAYHRSLCRWGSNQTLLWFCRSEQNSEVLSIFCFTSFHSADSDSCVHESAYFCECSGNKRPDSVNDKKLCFMSFVSSGCADYRIMG